MKQIREVGPTTARLRVGMCRALDGARVRKSPHPAAKVAGLPASYPACAPGGESKDSPSSLSFGIQVRDLKSRFVVRDAAFGIFSGLRSLVRDLLIGLIGAGRGSAKQE